MKKDIIVPLTDTPLTLLSGITFARVPYWFPFYDYKDLKMDLVLPFRRGGGEKRPLLVWICGGAWLTMERGAHLPWLMNFARSGYVIASVEYRLSNCSHFPSQLEDVKKGIRFLKAHAGEFGIDPEKVIIGGESAGAHLACMAGVTGDRKEFDKGEYLEQSGRVQAVIDYYGPASFTWNPKDTRVKADGEIPDFLRGPSPVNMLLGYDPADDPEKADTAAPLSYISPSAPPFFIAHGTEDVVVSIDNSEALCSALEMNNVPVEFCAVQGAGHADPRFYQTEMADRIMGFLDGICNRREVTH